MPRKLRAASLIGIGLLTISGCSIFDTTPSTGPMSFFITSTPIGKGADLGGLEGADRHCQALASKAAAGNRTWRAYLSTQSTALNDPKAVDARDRIGTGPWYNAKGVLIAKNVADLHSASNNVTRQTALSEKGELINSRAEKPSKHDILTGTREDGTSFPSQPFADMTCGNWTKSGTDGSAMLGHFDRAGPSAKAWATSWNSSHPSLGCTQEGLIKTGGDGLLYCFAEK